MSLTSFKDWVYTNLTASLSDEPATFPYSGAAGLMKALGFDSSKVEILRAWPARKLSLSKAAVIIDLPRSSGQQKTGGGAQGETIEEITVVLTAMWVADFAGKPEAVPPVAPKFTSEVASDQYFTALVDTMKLAARYMVYAKYAPGQYWAHSWPLSDTVTGQESIVAAQVPLVEAYYDQPRLSENGKNVLYVAYIEVRFLESFQSVQPVGL